MKKEELNYSYRDDSRYHQLIVSTYLPMDIIVKEKLRELAGLLEEQQVMAEAEKFQKNAEIRGLKPTP